MKKYFLSLSVILCAIAVFAQTTFYVCKKDGSYVSYAIADVDSITFNLPKSENPDPEPDPDCISVNVANGRNNTTFTTSNANNGTEGFCSVGNGFTAINICNENLSNGNNILGATATTSEVAVMVDLGDTYSISSIKLFQGSTNASYPDSYCSSYKVYYSTDAVSASNKGNIGWNYIAVCNDGSIYSGAQKTAASTNVSTTGDVIDFYGTYDARSIKIIFDKESCKGTGATNGTVSLLSLQVFGCEIEKGDEPIVTPPASDDSERTDILFIGNSLTYYNTLAKVVEGIAKLKGHNVTCTATTNGGQNLIYQSKAKNVLDSIKNGRYEIVILQDIVGSFNADSLQKGAATIIPIIKQYNPNAKFVFYAPWPVEGKLTGASSTLPYVTWAYSRTARENDAKMAPAGETFYDMYVNENAHYYADDRHPQPLGTFISASTIYHTLYPDEECSQFTEAQHATINNFINKNVAYTNKGQQSSYSLDTLNMIFSKGCYYAKAIAPSVADKSGKTKYTSIAGTYVDPDEGLNPNNLPSQTGTVVDASVFATNNMARGTTATASSATQAASNATDGNNGSRWESKQSDPQWIYIDLGSTKSFSKVGFMWEGAYASRYYIQTSNDATNWTTRAVVTAKKANNISIDLSETVSARYVRMYGTARGTGYGYSIYEIGVWE